MFHFQSCKRKRTSKIKMRLPSQYLLEIFKSQVFNKKDDNMNCPVFIGIKWNPGKLIDGRMGLRGFGFEARQQNFQLMACSTFFYHVMEVEEREWIPILCLFNFYNCIHNYKLKYLCMRTQLNDVRKSHVIRLKSWKI